MAGIGFELKKIFRKEGISRLVSGAAYSTLITVGPTIMVIFTIVLLYYILNLIAVPYNERELLSSTILYVFIFSLLTTSGFNGVMSRYIADKIYEEKYDDILPSFYTGIFLNTLVGAILGIPFILRVIFIGEVDLMFSFMSYCFFIVMIITFYSMIYLSATKDYKIIALYYTIGMTVTFISAILFHIAGLITIKAILYGITLGFFVIAFLEFSYMKKYFNSNSKNYKDCLHYFIDHKEICFCNFFYILGLYIHNFVFWTHPSRIVIAKSYVSMQSYDMASCLAMFTNISTIIIFTVMAETKFHDKYQLYNEAVIGKTLKDINITKKSMFRLLMQQINYLVGIQVVITMIIFLMAIIILPVLGFAGSVIAIYPSLTGAYFVIFLMYCNIIFMFYFDDNKGAMFTSIVFCLSVLLGSVLSIKLSESLYGLGAFLGGFVSWSVSYFRIRYMEKHFDEHIFCRGNILKKVVGEVPDSRVYVNYFKDKSSGKATLPMVEYYQSNEAEAAVENMSALEIVSIKCLTESAMFVNRDIKFEVDVNNKNKKSVLYKFIKLYENGEIKCIQDYSPENTLVFREMQEGDFKILCYVKHIESDNKYDDRALIHYSTKKYNPAKIQQVSTDIISPQFIGKTITIKAISEGERKVLYRFIIEGDKTEDSGYIESNIYEWNSQKEGNYKITIMVKNEVSETMECEDSEEFEYVIENPAEIECVLKDFKEYYTIEDSIILEIISKNLSEVLVKYKIYINDFLVEETEYSKAKKYIIRPKSKGKYRVEVFAKSIKSPENYDCMREVNFFINDTMPIQSIKIISDNNDFYVNEVVNFNIFCNGGNDLCYEFYLLEKEVWKKTQKYSKKSFYSFMPFLAGEYKLLVLAKEYNNNTPYEAYDMITFNVKDKNI